MGERPLLPSALGLWLVTLAALGCALALDLDKAIACALDGFANHAAVQFNLGFTWTAARTNATTLAF